MEIEEKEIILTEARRLIELYDELNIIYVRVSTTDKDQDERDQIPKIVNTFNLDIDKCLLIEAKESGYNLNKQAKRKFEIIKQIVKQEEFKDYEKNIYIWKLNRLYRNRELLVNFGLDIRNYNAKIYSVSQKILAECIKYEQPMRDIIYYLMLQMYGHSAEEESRNKAEDLKKSLTKKGDKYYTNKGNMFGRKLIKKIVNEGKDNEKKIYFNQEELDNINILILKAYNKKYSYRKIVMYFKHKKNINLSTSYVYRIIKNNSN